MKNSSLVVVGVGIKLIAHLTTEAKAYIEQADQVLYLVNEPLMKEWLHSKNKNAVSLDNIYLKFNYRHESYSAISEFILAELRKEQHICVVIYGHPTVYAQPALDAVIQAQKENFYTKILPGISAEDCLYADLLINPGSSGCISYDVTDLLIHRRRLDSGCHVILWQVSIIGMMDHDKDHDNTKGLRLLYHYLLNYYNENHELISYSAAQYPSFEPAIKQFTLGQLPNMQFTRTSILYIPPHERPVCDLETLAELGIPSGYMR